MSKFKEDMSKFTIGDEVQISDGSIYKSQAYKDGEKMRGVITDHSRITWHIVTWENGRINSYQDDDLEPYSKAQFKATNHGGFELNERVIVCESGYGIRPADIGKEFIIVEFGDYNGDPGVKLRDTETNMIYPNSSFNDFVGINSIKKLETKLTSEPERNVTFTVNGETYRYELNGTYYCNTCGDNETIFGALGVDKRSFCSEAYGYEAETGDWPEWREGDKEAPIKIVKAIREKIKEIKSQEQVSVSMPISRASTHKFEIGDTIIGNEKANYGVTVQGWRGVVTEVGSNYFKAKGQSDDIEFGGLGYDHFDLLSKVIDKQAILEEAKRLYPIGTQYRPLDGKGNPYTSCGVSAWGCKWVKNPDGSLIGIDCGIGYVYVDGKWANIHTGIMTAPEFVKVAAASLYGSIGTPSPIEKALPDLQSPIMVPKSTSRSKIKVL